MAVEVESTSQIEEFLGILKKRAWWIAVPALIVIALGTSFAVIVPKKFVTSTKVLVRDTMADIPGASSDSSQEAVVAPHQLKSQHRITQVLEKLEWPDYLDLASGEVQDYLKRVQENLKVDQPATGGEGQHIVKLAFSHTDPDRSFQFLVAASETWQEEVLERGRTAEQRHFQALQQQKLNKEAEAVEIRKELRDIRKAHSIPAPTPGGRTNIQTPAEPVHEQLAEYETELEDVELQIEQTEAKIATLTERRHTIPNVVPKEFTDEEGIDNAKQIATLRQKIQEYRRRQDGLTSLHSTHKRYEQMIEDALAQIRFLEETEIEPVTSEQMAPNEEWVTLGERIVEEEQSLAALVSKRESYVKRIEDAKIKIEDLTEAYHQIAQLEDDLAVVQEELRIVARQLQEKSNVIKQIEGPAGDPFEVLDKARRPSRPTEPDPALIVVFSIFVGLGLGLGLAVAAEYSRSCFRSVADISRVMVVPVLGTINRIPTRRERRRTLYARAAVGSVTFVLVGFLAYVTWTWSEEPQRLSPGLRNTIEGFREQFE